MENNPQAKPKRRFSFIPLFLFLGGGFILWTIFNPISESFDQSYFEKAHEASGFRDSFRLNTPPGFIPEIQTNKNSSGFVVISMISTLMGNPVSQKEVMTRFEKKGKRGIFPSSFIYYLRSYIPGYKISLIHPTNDNILKGVLMHQLQNNIPVPVLISTTNLLTRKNRINLNYSLVIAYDKRSEIVTLASTFGFLEKISYNEFKNRLDHSNYKNIPLLLKIAIRLRLYELNNIFYIENRKDLSLIL